MPLHQPTRHSRHHCTYATGGIIASTEHRFSELLAEAERAMAGDAGPFLYLAQQSLADGAHRTAELQCIQPYLHKQQGANAPAATAQVTLLLALHCCPSRAHGGAGS